MFVASLVITQRAPTGTKRWCCRRLEVQMEAKVKPGTRCGPEARESVPNAHREDHEPLGIRGGTGFQQCTNEAVRMVTVREYHTLEGTDTRMRQEFDRDVKVPMCAACAAWHEAKTVPNA